MLLKKYITDSRKVYSLEVEGGNYIADGIVTHNSIYGGQVANLDC